ncbi:MAG: hypothetical protein HQL06_02855 [Nitrospirae bacterium]|nr:hypothetical protein [Nitrospirota bacterium]
MFVICFGDNALSAQSEPKNAPKGETKAVTNGAPKSDAHKGDVQGETKPAPKGELPGSEPKVSQVELNRRELDLKRKEERLQALKADIDKRIERYEKLLSQVEEALNKVKDSDAERIKKLVKTYEAMPSEEASVQLSALEEDLAVTILIRMNNKKAGAALAQIEPQKAAVLSKKMSKTLNTVNNFPGK